MDDGVCYFWRKRWDDRTFEVLIHQIDEAHTIIARKIPIVSSEFWIGYSETHEEKYLAEALSVEQVERVSAERVGRVLRGRDETIFLDKQDRKIRNLHNAIRYLFGEPSMPFVRPTHLSFDPMLAIYIHRLVGDQLFSDPGRFRTTEAKPAHQEQRYCAPNRVRSELETLFADTRRSMEHATLRELMGVAGRFMGRFLWIHPFTNGNGRTARLLLSYVLCEKVVVPVSLYVGSNLHEARACYLTCLAEGHELSLSATRDLSYKMLTMLITEAVLQNVEDVVTTLNLRDSQDDE